jgi:hypothetical protein
MSAVYLLLAALYLLNTFMYHHLTALQLSFTRVRGKVSVSDDRGFEVLATCREVVEDPV